jgi:hypothetical protein
MARKEVAIITDKYLRKKVWMLGKSADKHRNDIRPGRRHFGVYRYLRDIYGICVDLRSRRIIIAAETVIAVQREMNWLTTRH